MKIIPVDNPRVEAVDVDMVVCARIEDVPVPAIDDAKRAACSKCGEGIWLSPRSPDKPAKVCTQCAQKAIIADGDEPTFMINRKHLR